ncbi:MAG: IS5 family transposase [Limisphaerales bacterium]
MQNSSYDTDINDEQWRLIESLLPPRKRMGRPPTPPRALLNAIFYLVKSGCPWRLLPDSFPPWKTVFDRFRKWCRDGTWILMNQALRALVRTEDGRDPEPSAAVVDSQTVRSDAHGGEVGYDAGKKTKGRKRFIIVNTLGLLLGVVVVPADVPERSGAQSLLESLTPALGKLRKLWADGGYSGPEFADWVRQRLPKLQVEVIKRNADVKGFKVLPKRWVVERTFGWLVQHRRLVRDYEKSECSAAGWIAVALTRVMLRRLA